MNNISRETLRRMNQNDPSLSKLRIGVNFGDDENEFHSDNSDDYSTLGAAIANNIDLEILEVYIDDLPPMHRGFYDGLKSNSSISDVELSCNYITIAGGVGQEILQAYQENNSHLTVLRIIEANLQSGGDRVIGDTLRSCRNLQKVCLNFCNITDEQLLPIVDAVRGHGISMLEELYLYENNIGNAGCEAIATVLIDPNCKIQHLSLGRNAIDNEGATTIANSLTNNNKLQQLYLHNNPIDQSAQDVFSRVLGNVSNINSLYASNHTLENLVFDQERGQQLESLLELNTHTNKSHVAFKKILKYQPNIDMEPLFEWDAEGEQTLKALPYVIDWFERARVAIRNDVEEEYNIEERKLSSIVQFAKAMPLLFEGISYISADNKKRKRED